MLLTRSAVGMLSIGALVLGASAVSAQDYPNKPIRIITGAVGGGSDIIARIIAQDISGSLGQSVIIDNRAGGTLSREAVAKAPPDGYTLLITGSSVWLSPLVQKVPYDPVRDFAPITLTDQAPDVLVVNPSVPVKSVKEFIALAKARPGDLNYSFGSIGGTAHMAAELFRAMAGIKLVGIPYKSDSQEVADLMGGYVQLSFLGAIKAVPLMKSGRLRGLGVCSLQPSTLVPGLPTVAASGLPGYESVSYSGVWAPAKTPATIITRLNQEVVRGLRTAETKQKLLSNGSEAVGNTPEEFANKINSEMTKWGKVIKDLGIRVE